MKIFQRILSNLSFFILVMLLFLLIFQDKISLPPILQSAGRTHPLILHLPIGLIILSFIFWLLRKNFEERSFQKIFILILQITTFVAALTALMGLFLSEEGGYDVALLSKHKFFGIAIAVLTYALLIVYKSYHARTKLISAIMIGAVIVLVLGSHFGATLTHGEGFVWEPLRNNAEEAEPITDSSTLYTAAIKPIFKSKCFSCHNEKKSKGELIMTTEEQILKGGKNGAIWVSGDALKSHIIQNLRKPIEDKKHMPPKGKPQLSEEEIQLLIDWVQDGADMNKRLKDYAENDPLKISAYSFIVFTENIIEEKSYNFQPASASLIEELNGPFCTVTPLSKSSPALNAVFLVREKFDPKKLEDLLKVKEQLVGLDLGNMPVTDAEMKTISGFKNLESLNLNNSEITNKGLAELSPLKKLISLSLAGTKLDNGASEIFGAMDSLKHVYLWNSAFSKDDIAGLRKKYTRIQFDTGFEPDKNEILTLTPPVMKNEEFILSANEKIELKHQVPGTIIRYTTDGSDPDSVYSPVYKDPIITDGYMQIKARTVKDGWYSSPVAAFYFYKKGITPDGGSMKYQPDKKYMGDGIKTLYDNKKGTADNFRDGSWLGFRETPFEAVFYFDNPGTMNSISVSYNINTQSYIMPPAEIVVWGGDNEEKLTLLKKITPAQLTKDDLNAVRAEGIKIELGKTAYRYYKILIKNVSSLPSWHPGKGDKGWLFIDEIFFN